jgi:hypothetical protein
MLAGAANAQYKCVAVGGAVTYQQAACPITQRQEMLHPAIAASAPARAASTPSATSRAPVAPTTARPADPAGDGGDMGRALTSLEAQFERLKRVQEELDAARHIAAK